MRPFHGQTFSNLQSLTDLRVGENALAFIPEEIGASGGFCLQLFFSHFVSIFRPSGEPQKLISKRQYESSIAAIRAGAVLIARDYVD